MLRLSKNRNVEDVGALVSALRLEVDPYDSLDISIYNFLQKRYSFMVLPVSECPDILRVVAPRHLWAIETNAFFTGNYKSILLTQCIMLSYGR